MIPCEAKRESIRSAVLGVYTVARSLKADGKIDDQEYVLILAHLEKIEKCTQLASTIEEMERRIEELKKEVERG